jgi:hypothetical protein
VEFTNLSHTHSHPRCKFTPKEDEKLKSWVEKYGNRHWEAIAEPVPGPSARQCRDRYKNYLLGNLVTTPWSSAEDQVVREKYVEFGAKWKKKWK